MRTAEIAAEQITDWERHNGVRADQTLLVRLRSEDGKHSNVMRISEAEVWALHAKLGEYLGVSGQAVGPTSQDARP